MDIKSFIEEEKKDFMSLKESKPTKIDSRPIPPPRAEPIMVKADPISRPTYSPLPKPNLQSVDTKPSKLNLPGEGIFSKLKGVF